MQARDQVQPVWGPTLPLSFSGLLEWGFHNLGRCGFSLLEVSLQFLSVTGFSTLSVILNKHVKYYF